MLDITKNVSGVATILIVVLVAIAALVGGAVVVWGNPGTLSFEEYLTLLQKFAMSVGILGVGRGIAMAGKMLGPHKNDIGPTS